MAIIEGKYCEIDDGLKLHFHDVGTGPAVVFLHGSGPGASGYSNFKLNFPAISRAGYRTIVPDLIGYGHSSKPADREYHLDFFVDCIVSLLDRIGVDTCCLVGNSLGGAIAIRLALRFSERVNKLVLMAPGGIEQMDVYMNMQGISKMMAGAARDGGVDRAGLRDLLSLQVSRPEELGEVLDQAVDERYPIAEQQPQEVLTTLRVPDQTDDLDKLQCPIIGFWGVDDLFCPPSGALKILERCQRARFQLLNRCGHWVMVEYPTLFNRECIAFLQE